MSGNNKEMEKGIDPLLSVSYMDVNSHNTEARKQYLYWLKTALEQLQEENKSLKKENKTWQSRYSQLSEKAVTQTRYLDVRTSSSLVIPIRVEHTDIRSKAQTFHSISTCISGLEIKRQQHFCDVKPLSIFAFILLMTLLCVFFYGLSVFRISQDFSSSLHAYLIKSSDKFSFGASSDQIMPTFVEILPKYANKLFPHKKLSTDDSGPRLAECLKELSQSNQSASLSTTQVNIGGNSSQTPSRQSKNISQLNDIFHRYGLEAKQTSSQLNLLPMLTRGQANRRSSKFSIPLWEQRLNRFLMPFIHDGQDLYVVSLAKNHILSPAFLQGNESHTTRMIFIMPMLNGGLQDSQQSWSPSNQLDLMHIHCEITNFTLSYIEKWKFPYP